MDAPDRDNRACARYRAKRPRIGNGTDAKHGMVLRARGGLSRRSTDDGTKAHNPLRLYDVDEGGRAVLKAKYDDHDSLRAAQEAAGLMEADPPLTSWSPWGSSHHHDNRRAEFPARPVMGTEASVGGARLAS